MTEPNEDPTDTTAATVGQLQDRIDSLMEEVLDARAYAHTMELNAEQLETEKHELQENYDSACDEVQRVLTEKHELQEKLDRLRLAAATDKVLWNTRHDSATAELEAVEAAQAALLETCFQVRRAVTSNYLGVGEEVKARQLAEANNILDQALSKKVTGDRILRRLWAAEARVRELTGQPAAQEADNC